MDIQRLQPRQTPLPVQWTELLKKTNLRPDVRAVLKELKELLQAMKEELT